MNAVAKPVRDRAAETAKLLRALANPQRLLILCHLRQTGEVSAGELARLFGMERSALSQHLTRMREEALIVQARDGRVLRYRLNDMLDARLPALLDNICAPDPAESAAANRATRAATAVSLAFASTLEADAAQTTSEPGPIVIGAGRFHRLPDVAYKPDARAVYRAVFAMTLAGKNPAKVNPALERMARVANMYAHAGVPANHLKFSGVAYGAATPIALNDEHYQALFGTPNPNLPVIHELRAHGIEVAVCGQAMVNLRYERTWVDRNVVVAFSALATIIEQGQQGYVLVQM